MAAFPICLSLFFFPVSLAYNNGVGERPLGGWSSWYAAPDGSQVTEAFVKANAQVLLDSGLSFFYNYINIDEGWVLSRNSTDGSLQEDFTKFPSGIGGFGEWVKSKQLKYGLYSCRGTCQCSTGKYSGPGSHGYEKEDTLWMIRAGAEWLKIDSCCSSQDHATAFSDYGKFRDAMNESGVPVYFNLCGWNPWYSPPDPALNYTGGGSLGNSFRIWGDGGNWGAITGAINTMAALADFNAPYGFNDPDNILGPHGTVGRVTEEQAKVQMILWCIAPTQLIWGEDMTQASAQYIETVGNKELLAINQDLPFMGPGRRIVGGDLTSPCAPSPPGALYTVGTYPCSSSDPSVASMQDWAVDATHSRVELLGGGGGGYITLNPTGCANGGANGSPVHIAALLGDTPPPPCQSQTWIHASSNHSLLGPFHKCLDEYQWTHATVDLWDCVPGAVNEAWVVTNGTKLVNADSGKCLTALPLPGPQSCTNIWARPLSSGATALGFVSNLGTPTNITCDASCFALANVTAERVRVRDVVGHVDLGVLTAPLSLTVLVGGGGGNGEAVVVTPV